MGNGNLNFAQLENLWIQAGGPYPIAPTMAAIGLAESSGNPNSVNASDNGGRQTSWGIWQVSKGNHDPYPNWNDPLTNAKIAVDKYNSQGISAWGSYTSGAYKRYLPAANRYATVTQGVGGGSASPGNIGSNSSALVGVDSYWKIGLGPLGNVDLDPLLFGGLASLGVLIFIAGAAFLVIGAGQKSGTAQKIVSTTTKIVPQLRAAKVVTPQVKTAVKTATATSEKSEKAESTKSAESSKSESKE